MAIVNRFNVNSTSATLNKDFINVNLENNHETAYSSSTDARNAVPALHRKAGLQITYLLADGWFMDQYVGSDINGWETDSNWNEIIKKYSTNKFNVESNIGINSYPLFKTNVSYTIGDIVRYNELLYEFKEDHPAGAWNDSHVWKTDVVNANIKKSFLTNYLNTQRVSSFNELDNFINGIDKFNRGRALFWKEVKDIKGGIIKCRVLNTLSVLVTILFSKHIENTGNTKTSYGADYKVTIDRIKYPQLYYDYCCSNNIKYISILLSKEGASPEITEEEINQVKNNLEFEFIECSDYKPVQGLVQKNTIDTYSNFYYGYCTSGISVTFNFDSQKDKLYIKLPNALFRVYNNLGNSLDILNFSLLPNRNFELSNLQKLVYDIDTKEVNVVPSNNVGNYYTLFNMLGNPSGSVPEGLLAHYYINYLCKYVSVDKDILAIKKLYSSINKNISEVTLSDFTLENHIDSTNRGRVTLYYRVSNISNAIVEFAFNNNKGLNVEIGFAEMLYKNGDALVPLGIQNSYLDISNGWLHNFILCNMTKDNLNYLFVYLKKNSEITEEEINNTLNELDFKFTLYTEPVLDIEDKFGQNINKTISQKIITDEFQKIKSSRGEIRYFEGNNNTYSSSEYSYLKPGVWNCHIINNNWNRDNVDIKPNNLFEIVSINKENLTKVLYVKYNNTNKDDYAPDDISITVPSDSVGIKIGGRADIGEIIKVAFYYERSNSIVEKYNTGENLNIKNNLLAHCDFAALFLSDIHSNTNKLNRCIQLSEAYDAVNCIIDGGDDIGSFITSDNQDDYKIFNDEVEKSTKVILRAVGNHDAWIDNYWTWTDNLSIYNKFTSKVVEQAAKLGKQIIQPENAATDGKNYYYYDEGSIRIIVILSLGMSAEKYYDDSQHSWFVSVLENAISSNKHIICVNHSPLQQENSEPVKSNFYDAYTGWSNGGIADKQFINNRALDAVDDFIDNGGKFICWLAGHTHHDFTLVSKNQRHTQFCFVTTSASVNNDSIRSSDPSISSYDALNLLGVDISNGLLKVWRIGCDTNFALQKKRTFVWDFINSKLISQS